MKTAHLCLLLWFAATASATYTTVTMSIYDGTCSGSLESAITVPSGSCLKFPGSTVYAEMKCDSSSSSTIDLTEYTDSTCSSGETGHKTATAGACFNGIAKFACGCSSDNYKLSVTGGGNTFDMASGSCVGSAFSSIKATCSGTASVTYATYNDTGCSTSNMTGSLSHSSPYTQGGDTFACATMSGGSNCDGSDSGLSTGAIIGIVIGGVVLLIIVAVVIYFCCCKKKQEPSAEEGGNVRV